MVSSARSRPLRSSCPRSRPGQSSTTPQQVQCPCRAAHVAPPPPRSLSAQGRTAQAVPNGPMTGGGGGGGHLPRPCVLPTSSRTNLLRAPSVRGGKAGSRHNGLRRSPGKGSRHQRFLAWGLGARQRAGKGGQLVSVVRAEDTSVMATGAQVEGRGGGD